MSASNEVKSKCIELCQHQCGNPYCRINLYNRAFECIPIVDEYAKYTDATMADGEENATAN